MIHAVNPRRAGQPDTSKVTAAIYTILTFTVNVFCVRGLLEETLSLGRLRLGIHEL